MDDLGHGHQGSSNESVQAAESVITVSKSNRTRITLLHCLVSQNVPETSYLKCGASEVLPAKLLTSAGTPFTTAKETELKW